MVHRMTSAAPVGDRRPLDREGCCAGLGCRCGLDPVVRTRRPPWTCVGHRGANAGFARAAWRWSRAAWERTLTGSGRDIDWGRAVAGSNPVSPIVLVSTNRTEEQEKSPKTLGIRRIGSAVFGAVWWTIHRESTATLRESTAKPPQRDL